MYLILRFFTNNGPFFTWLVLAIFSIVLLGQSDPYHRSIWFGGANVVSGEVSEVADDVFGYFGLRTANGELMRRLALAEEENQQLRQELQERADVDLVLRNPRAYTYLAAHVVDNSITRSENYLVINKGERDSIRVGMAVANQNGVVGLVSQVSSRYAQVISVLNPKLQLSVCLKESQSAGSLVWTGGSPNFARLEDLPRNLSYEVGDTVVTSGFGGAFPRGVPVGRITRLATSRDNNFLAFDVELFTHFDRLSEVYVIQNHEPCPF